MADERPTGQEGLRLRLLVLRCQTGDEAAFRELYEEFSGRTRRFAGALLDDGSAEDVQQEVWLSVYRRIGQLTDPGAFRTWLYMTTRHSVIDLLRRRRREAELLALQPAASKDTDVHEHHDTTEPDRAVIRSAIAQLPPVQREVVMLRFWDDMTYAEISLIVGCSIGTVRSRLHYARRALEKLLQDSDSNQGGSHEQEPARRAK